MTDDMIPVPRALIERALDGIAADELLDALNRAKAAERVIADAPHARDCWHYGVVANGAEHVGPCTCWKAEYARASQPAPTEGDAS